MSTKPRGISGFPEWTPAARQAELRWLDGIRATFESWGYANIETPAVELLEHLLAKGETDKEIYTLTRLQADEGSGREPRLGLHFDLTVPFARYVGQHFNDLSFPFKRHSIQKVWRGERPQDGRFREFTQCDIDVVAVDQLDLGFDSEVAAVALEALARIHVGPVRLHLSNRKILNGYLAGLGIADTARVVRILDKIDKIGRAGVLSDLQNEAGLAVGLAERVLQLGEIRTPDTGFVKAVQELGVTDPVLEEGLDELARVMDDLAGHDILADLAIARGFDYYTGTIYEGRLVDGPEGYGSVVSGGRYDDLAGAFINRKLPGVGISIGLSRLFARMLADGKVDLGRSTPTDLLIIRPHDEGRSELRDLAAGFRARGIATELYPNAGKLKRQLGYAERKGIPFVWFPPFEGDIGAAAGHEVKNMITGEQGPADPARWTPTPPPPAAGS